MMHPCPSRLGLGTAFAAALAILPATGVPATPDCAADAMLVFDGSASMEEVGFEFGDVTRIAEARRAVARVMPSIADIRRVGLVVYGPGTGGACSNIDLRFAPIADAGPRVISAIEGLRPGGLTPLAASVATAAAVLDDGVNPGVIVLVTDGNETCGGTPCALGARLAAEAPDLTIHVIGFRVRVDFFSWDNPEQVAAGPGATVSRCLADRTGGLFRNTETVDELAAALQETLGCALIGMRPRDLRLPAG